MPTKKVQKIYFLVIFVRLNISLLIKRNVIWTISLIKSIIVEYNKDGWNHINVKKIKNVIKKYVTTPNTNEPYALALNTS